MKTLRQWKNKAYREATLPILDLEKSKIGNGLEDVESGGKILGSPFKKKVESFKSKITELPTPEANKGGLGELGMQKVGDATFGKDRLQAGRTPTISHGVPVQEEVLTEVNLPRPVQFLVDRVLSMLGDNPYRAMALQQYIGQKLQGLLQGAGNSWARRGAMANKTAGAEALRGIGQPQPQPEMGAMGAMEAVGTPMRAHGLNYGGQYGAMPGEDLEGFGEFRPRGEDQLGMGQNDMAARWLRGRETELATPDPGEPPIPGPEDEMPDGAPDMDMPDDPMAAPSKIDTGWGRDLANDLRHSKGDSGLRKDRARIAMAAQMLTRDQLKRTENLWKMMKVPGYEESGE